MIGLILPLFIFGSLYGANPSLDALNKTRKRFDATLEDLELISDQLLTSWANKVAANCLEMEKTKLSSKKALIENSGIVFAYLDKDGPYLFTVTLTSKKGNDFSKTSTGDSNTASEIVPVHVNFENWKRYDHSEEGISYVYVEDKQRILPQFKLKQRGKSPVILGSAGDLGLGVFCDIVIYKSRISLEETNLDNNEVTLTVNKYLTKRLGKILFPGHGLLCTNRVRNLAKYILMYISANDSAVGDSGSVKIKGEEGKDYFASYVTLRKTDNDRNALELAFEKIDAAASGCHIDLKAEFLGDLELCERNDLSQVDVYLVPTSPTLDIFKAENDFLITVVIITTNEFNKMKNWSSGIHKLVTHINSFAKDVAGKFGIGLDLSPELEQISQVLIDENEINVQQGIDDKKEGFGREVQYSQFNPIWCYITFFRFIPFNGSDFTNYQYKDALHKLAKSVFKTREMPHFLPYSPKIKSGSFEADFEIISGCRLDWSPTTVGYAVQQTTNMKELLVLLKINFQVNEGESSRNGMAFAQKLILSSIVQPFRVDVPRKMTTAVISHAVAGDAAELIRTTIGVELGTGFGILEFSGKKFAVSYQQFLSEELSPGKNFSSKYLATHLILENFKEIALSYNMNGTKQGSLVRLTKKEKNGLSFTQMFDKFSILDLVQLAVQPTSNYYQSVFSLGEWTIAVIITPIRIQDLPGLETKCMFAIRKNLQAPQVSHEILVDYGNVILQNLNVNNNTFPVEKQRGGIYADLGFGSFSAVRKKQSNISDDILIPALRIGCINIFLGAQKQPELESVHVMSKPAAEEHIALLLSIKYSKFFDAMESHGFLATFSSSLTIKAHSLLGLDTTTCATKAFSAGFVLTDNNAMTLVRVEPGMRTATPDIIIKKLVSELKESSKLRFDYVGHTTEDKEIRQICLGISPLDEIAMRQKGNTIGFVLVMGTQNELRYLAIVYNDVPPEKLLSQISYQLTKTEISKKFIFQRGPGESDMDLPDPNKLCPPETKFELGFFFHKNNMISYIVTSIPEKNNIEILNQFLLILHGVLVPKPIGAPILEHRKSQDTSAILGLNFDMNFYRGIMRQTKVEDYVLSYGGSDRVALFLTYPVLLPTNDFCDTALSVIRDKITKLNPEFQMYNFRTKISDSNPDHKQLDYAAFSVIYLWQTIGTDIKLAVPKLLVMNGIVAIICKYDKTPSLSMFKEFADGPDKKRECGIAVNSLDASHVLLNCTNEALGQLAFESEGNIGVAVQGSIYVFLFRNTSLGKMNEMETNPSNLIFCRALKLLALEVVPYIRKKALAAIVNGAAISSSKWQFVIRVFFVIGTKNAVVQKILAANSTEGNISDNVKYEDKEIWMDKEVRIQLEKGSEIGEMHYSKMQQAQHLAIVEVDFDQAQKKPQTQKNQQQKLVVGVYIESIVPSAQLAQYAQIPKAHKWLSSKAIILDGRPTRRGIVVET